NTDYAIELALNYSTSIISADSRQCYRELNIGVAKPSPQQLSKVPHYFINSHSIKEEVNAKVFENYALNAAETIFKENDVLVMVGGTGLYIKAFAEGFDEMPKVDKAIREEILATYHEKGLVWLDKEIELKDPKFFSEGEME